MERRNRIKINASFISKLFYFCLLIGFFSQVVVFGFEYLQYATVQQIDTKFQTKLHLPAVTFCDKNLDSLLNFQNNSQCHGKDGFCNYSRNYVTLTKRDSLKCATFFSRLQQTDLKKDLSEKFFDSYTVPVNERLQLVFNTKGREEFISSLATNATTNESIK